MSKTGSDLSIGYNLPMRLLNRDLELITSFFFNFAKQRCEALQADLDEQIESEEQIVIMKSYKSIIAEKRSLKTYALRSFVLS